MNDQAGLERGYRRLLACYPRSFRRDSEEDVLAAVRLMYLGAAAELGALVAIAATGGSVHAAIIHQRLGLAATALVFNRRSNSYYKPVPAPEPASR